MEKIDKPISNIHKIANPPKMEPPEEHQEEIISTVKKEPISPENPKSILIKEYQRGLIPDPVLIKDNPNPYLFSTTNFHPFSFLTGHRKWGFDNSKHLTSPSPTLLTQEQWLLEPDLTKAGILHGMIIDDTRGLVLVDKDITKKFSGLLKDLISSLLTIAMGKKVSLKVKLFEPKSVLQRITDYWSFLPKFLTPTYDITRDPLERFKYIMTFAVSGLYIPTKQLKPFNALICETFEGEFQNDEYKTKLYMEQISNYPTVSRFYAVNSEITFHGYVDLSAHTESLGTKFSFVTKGYVNIDNIHPNERILYIFPSIKMLRITKEEGRSAYWQNCLVFVDVKNKLKGVIRLGRDYSKIHSLEGYILQFDFPEGYQMDYNKEQDFGNRYNPSSNTHKVLSVCKGSWLESIEFDGKKYWDIDTDVPNWIKPERDCLPSDGRYREDLIWLYRSFYLAKNENERVMYEGLAQNWKLMIEKLQREEREMKARKNAKPRRKLFGWI